MRAYPVSLRSYGYGWNRTGDIACSNYPKFILYYATPNLRGRSFRGQNLNGADFSGADIRSTDFTCATLIGANFTNTQAGLQRRWVVGLLVCLWILVGTLGYFSSILGAVTLNLLTPNDLTLINLISAINLLMTLAIFFVAIFREGLVAFAVAFAIAFAFTVVGAAAGAIIVAGAGPVTGVEVVVVAVSFVVAFTLASTYIVWRGWIGDEKYTLVRSFAIAFAAIGGTNFRGANLSNANFNQARLKSTDMRKAILTRTCWYKTKMLEQVRPGKTYLQNAQVRQVLVTGYGQGNNFDRQDLRGVNFQQAHLADASFIGADLSSANLQDADLSRAKLVQTQLDETDLTGATLTGACIEDWGITSHTKLDGVRCDYVFMRYVEPKDLDQNRRRKPDNWEEKFEDGDFADFIKPMVDTLDLYHNQEVDPRAIAIAFKQLAENHPDAELEIAAMEKRGQDKFLLRAKTAPDTDKSLLNSEYFSTYNQFKGLSEQEVYFLLVEKNIRLQEKANQISQLETVVRTTLQPPKVYSETHIHKVETMTHNPGGLSVGGSVGGNLNNVQGDRNRTIQGDDNQSVLGDNNRATQRNQADVDPETPLTQADVIKLLAELETLIHGAEIPAELKAEAIEDLSAVKNATDKEEPNKTRALARLDSVAETLEKTSKTVDSGKKLWSTAKPIIAKIAGWLSAAAGSHLLG